MKRLFSVLACITLLSSVGCCCLNSCVNECGPHASDLAGGGGCLAKFARSHGARKCKCQHCMGYGGMYADPIYGMPYGGDGCCGGGFDGGMMMGGFPDAGGAGCGCAAGGGAMAPSIPPAPPSNYAPQGSPTPAPMPEANDNAIPAPPDGAAAGTPMTYQPAPVQPNVQNVSVEEFQRLPGSIISGPTTTPVPSPATGPMTAAPPRPSYPSAVNPGVRPANWQPAR